jgi:alpha-tubulin suppressor-like RCC1 family protein
VLAAFIVARWPRHDVTKFSIGPPLPPGKLSPQLVTTWDTAVLLAPDGSLWGWGGTQFQLSHVFGKPVVTQRPQRIGASSDWTRVAASFTHVLALKSDGSLWGWGNNSSGQIAQPSPTNFIAPIRIGREKWSQISVGASHSLALKADGSLWAWGQNDRGQVGDGTKSNKFTPRPISPDRDWKWIEAGAFNSFALKQDGTIWGWGLDPVTGGFADWLSPQQLDTSTNWVSLSASDYCLLAIKSDGTLWLRGQNAGSAAPDFTSGSSSTFIQIGPDKDWKEAYAGQGFFFARKTDGSWWACGRNDSGQLGSGLNLRGSVGSPRRLPVALDPWALAAGNANTILLARDGTLWTWGIRLGTGTRAKSSSVKGVLNSVSMFLLHRRWFKTADPVEDADPYRLWELPPEVRQSLETHQSSKPAATNEAAAMHTSPSPPSKAP